MEMKMPKTQECQKKITSKTHARGAQPKISSFFATSAVNNAKRMDEDGKFIGKVEEEDKLSAKSERGGKRKLDEPSEMRKMRKYVDPEDMGKKEATQEARRRESDLGNAKPPLKERKEKERQSWSFGSVVPRERKEDWKNGKEASKEKLERSVSVAKGVSGCENDSTGDFYGIPSEKWHRSNTTWQDISKSDKGKGNDRARTTKKDEASMETGIDYASTEDLENMLEDDWDTEPELDLREFQRCRVTQVVREPKSTTLTIRHEKFVRTRRVQCTGLWKDLDVAENDIVSIQAKDEGEYWLIDNNSGFVVVKPDLLISGTTVVDSLFCRRRTVLAEKFKKMEALPHQTSDNHAATIGSLVHRLLQEAICQDIRSVSDVRKIVEEIMGSRSTAISLYASGIAYDECREKMVLFAPRIYEFMEEYVRGKRQRGVEGRKERWNGEISEIRDIEESIWVPALGLKGKIDVSVEAKIDGKKSIVPLEIKTGRPSFSSEHKGQVILYSMMMGVVGQDVDAGLLLYIRENSIREIKGAHREKRDLISLRNSLANYLSGKWSEMSLETEAEPSLPRTKLPKPIYHHSACESCFYNTVCCVYSSREEEVELEESHPLMLMRKEIVPRLEASHIDYVLKWVSLLELEERGQNWENRMKELWTVSPERREAKGNCMANLELLEVRFVEESSRYEHTLVREEDPKKWNNPSFARNDYIMIGTDSQINISMGYVLDVTKDVVVVLLDRNISKYGGKKFHMDKYVSFSSNCLNYASVAGLLSDNEICRNLRSIVIDKKAATFSNQVPRSIIEDSALMLRDLNENQQKAVLKATGANEYMLIKGMPGTGKTKTLVALIKLLNRLSYSILISAHTHSAVDNILVKLLEEGVDFLRLGSDSAIHPLVIGKGESRATSGCCTPESLNQVYESKNIVGVTCLGSNHMLLGKRMFDFCIVDESAQALQPSVIRPLYNARKFILAGDPDQLAPVLSSKKARKLGGEESLFARLDSENNTVILKKQYRMNKSIMDVANKLTYRDKLRAGNEEVEWSTFVGAHMRKLKEEEKWKQAVLSRKMERSVVILNTDSTYDLERDEDLGEKFGEADCTYANVWEGGIIVQLTATLAKVGVEEESIGIIAPYRSQVGLLRKLVNRKIEVNTVDQYQGRDKGIIFYSCTRSFSRKADNGRENGTTKSNKQRELEILEDHRRLTVAVTRAKHKLILIADKESVAEYSPFRKLFDIVEEGNIIDLKNGCDDFAWTDIRSCL